MANSSPESGLNAFSEVSRKAACQQATPLRTLRQSAQLDHMSLNTRKLIGAVALSLLLLLALAVRYIADIPQDAWKPLWSFAYVLVLCVALFMAFYDRKIFPEKAWDFNPKRGVLYFFLGWIIFPFMMVIDAIFGVEFTMSGMAVGTFVMSVLIGIAGTFTENVGV